MECWGVCGLAYRIIFTKRDSQLLCFSYILIFLRSFFAVSSGTSFSAISVSSLGRSQFVISERYTHCEYVGRLLPFLHMLITGEVMPFANRSILCSFVNSLIMSVNML